MRLADSQVAFVFKGETLCGTIARTTSGSAFEYDPGYLRSPGALAAAFSLPLREEPFKARGTNLLPFFANLLPEGWVLQAVLGRLKTSPDDLLSALVEIGRETVGDVWLSWDAEPKPDDDQRWDLRSMTFDELLRRQYADPSLPLRRVSFPGVQDKVSASRVTLVGRRSRAGEAIIKINRDPDRYPLLIENEHFFMRLAKACGIQAANTRLISDVAGSVGLLVERFDRDSGRRLHQEDGCQILDVYPSEKYNVSARELIAGLTRVCTAGRVEAARFLAIYAFSYVISNGDLHAKNVSVLESEPGIVSLSPAYDLLSTLPYKDDRMAIPMDGRDRNFTGRSFVRFGELVGVPEAEVRHRLGGMLRRLHETRLSMSEIGFDDRVTRHLEREMRQRASRLADFA